MIAALHSDAQLLKGSTTPLPAVAWFVSGRLDKAASAPCFCICCQNWLSARPWRTEDSVLYFQGFGSLVAEYSLLQVVYCVASLPWEVGKEINTLPLVVSFDNLKEQAVYLLSFSMDTLRFGLRAPLHCLSSKSVMRIPCSFYAVFSLALVQILVDNTNLYAAQNVTQGWVDTTIDEMKVSLDYRFWELFSCLDKLCIGHQTSLWVSYTSTRKLFPVSKH